MVVDGSPTTSSTNSPTRVPSAWRRVLWPDWPSRKRMLRVEAWGVVLASYLLLTLAYLWPQNYRNESAGYVTVAWLAFLVRVLQFHLGLLLLAIALVAAFVRGRRLFFCATPLVLFTIVPPLAGLLTRYPYHKPQPAVLSVMTCNLLMVNPDVTPLLNEMLTYKPHVLLLQEYTPRAHEAAKAALAADYPYSSFVTRDDSFGVAIYSRLPFVGEVDNRFPLGRAGVEQTRAVIRVGNRDVAVYNVHLLPPRRLDYTIDSRLQFADLCKALSEEKLPYVVAGDLNLTETTPQHRDLKRLGAADAHDSAGWAPGWTWPVNSIFRYVPGLRMDHVYVGNGLFVTRCETGEGYGSDHRPVIADVGWAASGPETAPGRAPTGGAPARP